MKVIHFQPFEYLVNYFPVSFDMLFVYFSLSQSCVYHDVIQINCNIPSIDEVLEYGVYYYLKGC